MRNSVLTRIDKDYFIPLRTSYISICEDNINAAFILAIFEYWTNVKIADKHQINIENKIRKGEGLSEITSDTWIYKTYEGIEIDSLNLLNRHGVKEGLTILLKLNFLEKRNNPKYKWDRTLQYKLNTELVNRKLHMWSIHRSHRDDGEVTWGRCNKHKNTSKITTKISPSKDGEQVPLAIGISEEDEIFIFQIWNRAVKTISDISCHKSIHSKCAPDKKSRSDPPTLLSIIRKVLISYTKNDITEAIKTYSEILGSDQYYYDYKFKTLGLFLSSEKGLPQFIPSASPKTVFLRGNFASDSFSQARLSISYLSLSFDPKSPLSTENSTYMGVPTELTKGRDVIEYYNDIKEHIKRDDFGYGHFVWLEEIMACLIFRKENPELLEEMMELHGKYVNRFKKELKAQFMKGE